METFYFLPEGLSGAYAPLVSCSTIKTPPRLYAHVHVHPHPFSQAIHHCGGTTMNIVLCLGFHTRGESASRTRGSEEKNLASPCGPTRYMTRISRVIRNLAVWSGSVKRCSNSHGFGRVRSGGYQVSRFGSGCVKNFSKSHGSGWVESGRVLSGRVGSGWVEWV